jgi:hypothetical protein
MGRKSLGLPLAGDWWDGMRDSVRLDISVISKSLCSVIICKCNKQQVVSN